MRSQQRKGSGGLVYPPQQRRPVTSFLSLCGPPSEENAFCDVQTSRISLFAPRLANISDPTPYSFSQFVISNVAKLPDQRGYQKPPRSSQSNSKTSPRNIGRVQRSIQVNASDMSANAMRPDRAALAAASFFRFTWRCDGYAKTMWKQNGVSTVHV